MSFWKNIFLKNVAGTVINPATSDAQTDGSQITKINDSASVTINPATSDNQTNGNQLTMIANTGGSAVNPMTNEAAVAGDYASKFVDETGTPYGVKHVQNKPSVSSMPYTYDIAEGNVSGHTPWSKIGYNPAVTTTREDVWSYGGEYVFPSAEMVMEVASSSATADADIGTILFTGTCDAGGTTTLMADAGVDFTATAAAGDYIIIDKAGTTPEWGVLTAVANGSVTFSGGLSSGGSCATARTYQILDSSAATGAMAVKIEYLDDAFAEKSEIVILNTTTYVDTVNSDLYRINSFRVIACGTKATPTYAAVGNLTLRGNVDTVTYSYILATFTRARNVMYTVPAGKTLYIVSWSAGASTPNDTKVQTCRVMTRANIEPSTKFKGSGMIFYPYTEKLVSNNEDISEFDVPTKLPAGTDIKVSAIGLTGFSGPVTTVLRGWLK